MFDKNLILIYLDLNFIFYFSGSALQCYSCFACKDDLSDAEQTQCKVEENVCLKATDSEGGMLIIWNIS